MSRRTKKRKPPVEARFKIGDGVRVKYGTRAPDHPDMPMGGWGGTIYQVYRNGMCSVVWSRETLAGIHPINKRRAAIEEREWKEHNLSQDDIELDPGGPLAIERPTEIAPRPLSVENQGDRVRMVFGVTSDDLLPDVDEESLETYYDYLQKNLSLPDEAVYSSEKDLWDISPPQRVVVVRFDRERAWDECDGILCEVRTAKGSDVVPLADLKFDRLDPNFQWADDYSAWFAGNFWIDEEDEFDGDDEADDAEERSIAPQNATWRAVAWMALEILAIAACFGAVAGAAGAAMPWARWAAYICGGAWAVLMALVNLPAAERDLASMRPKFRKSVGIGFWLMAGTVQGAAFGIMAVAFIGAGLGGLAGYAVSRLLGSKKAAAFQIFPSYMLIGAACGAAVQAFYINRAAAASGLEYGALAGLGCAILLCLVALPLSHFAMRNPSSQWELYEIIRVQDEGSNLPSQRGDASK